MKELSQCVKSNFDGHKDVPELALLKALVQFSIQVESREIDLKDLLKLPRKVKDNETIQLWGEDDDGPKCQGNSRSSSTEGRIDRMPLTKYWRRPSLSRAHRPKRGSGTCPSEDGAAPYQDILENNMSLQQQLANTALNLSATSPASSTALSNQGNNWVQLSGHPGSLSPAGPGTIWKKQPGDTNETWVYEALMADSAREIVPKFYREITYDRERFIEISDLLYDFNCPTIMDIKIGCRTFLESEVSNTKARNDLYKKMLKLNPNFPTAEEHKAEAITKLRYMNFRDTMSSSRSLSFRIDALKIAGSSSVTELQKIRAQGDVVEVLATFIQKKEFVKKQILNRLRVISNTFENSEFFKTHEVIGSSILIVYDESHVGAWIIDFAKTCPLSFGAQISHRNEWEPGNHEEGYLTGLDNLIKCFEEVPTTKSRKFKLLS